MQLEVTQPLAEVMITLHQDISPPLAVVVLTNPVEFVQQLVVAIPTLLLEVRRL